MQYFFDQHFHVMNIAHPNLLSFFSSLESGIPDLITSGALSPSYILTNKNRKGSTLLNRVTNTLTTFEQSIGKTFVLMEDDLSGFFPSHEDGAARPLLPYIRNGKMHMRSRTYDRLAMCPLLMDFSSNEQRNETLYYPTPKEQKILAYVQDTLEGFAYYETQHPQGLFSFYPFLGINPPVHSKAFITQLLETYVVKNRTNPKGKRFYGIKFYPPLGYEPWPTDEREREKVLLIYAFCNAYDIPIMTHCDDQGFRGIPAKEAWKYTAPASYKPVLERFPNLRIDFAHYGWQYNQLQKNPLTMISSLTSKLPDSPWFYELTELMTAYPNVYADVSFSGTNPDFYMLLQNYLHTLEADTRRTILSKTLFGTDFSVNLMKVESYTSYYRIFEESAFSDDEVHAIVSTNPMRYMRLET
ncbi:MAG: amidohydrolase family protein [Sphaerochaeta sp.]|jgi:predicted TIM-barrel fold metal-dependent hydrolase|uniref:amidohydrolase family protein n=1 Tax=Sphaerochaeta sp. TaxID=1972642 RepID=UPI002FC7E7F2